jgi:hypothetical protein
VGNGTTVSFWKDIWLGDTPLALQCLFLYYTIQQQKNLVANILGQTPLNIGFRRLLTDNKWNEWLYFWQGLMVTQLSDELDKFIWNLTTNGLFTIKWTYYISP